MPGQDAQWFLYSWAAPIVSTPEEIAGLAATLPRPLVFTCGVFDLLHAGHVDSLQAARRFGRALVVGVNSDASVRLLGKEPGRPIHAAADRASVLAGLAVVDAVVCFDEDTPLAVLRLLRPDVFVKGSDYDARQLPETALVRQWGGRVEIVPRVRALSTTAVIERVRAAQAASPAS
ncbi:MAG: adenylyltransferase/cytidyltransferase family protein [Rubrivivax sp.]|nr:adenylyltransferase/cytidyltransferase family protein [Rubrivivax sp.]